MTATRALALLTTLALLQACASAPTVERAGASDVPLQTVKDRSTSQIRSFVDAEGLKALTKLGLPSVTMDAAAAHPKVSASQADLVANRAARDICNGLAAYFQLHESTDQAQVELRVLAVRPTSAATSGVSEVVGFFVPGPFRIPAGLGGLAVDGLITGVDQPLLLLEWAQGANPVTENARVSAIGDAYQLAGSFADDFVDLARAALAPAKGRAPRLPSEVIDANKALCETHYGKTNLVGAGATLLVGIAPEAIDPGKPAVKLPPVDD